MKRKYRGLVYGILCICMICIFSGISYKKAYAADVDCTTYTGDNIGDQDYTWNWSSVVNSYLYDCGDGTLLRVQYVSSVKKIVIEYYDASTYQLVNSKMIDPELPLFGGFYAMNGNYYILTGQENPNESNAVEVYRITKYDTNWNKISNCGLFGANTYIPFDAGSARMTHTGNYLVIRTCHEMYKSSDGYHHQANVTIEVDTANMKVTDSYTGVMSISYGYVSHSFNQFVKIKDGKIVAVDHGDAYPRSIVLCKYNYACTSGTFAKSVSSVDMVKPDGGETGDNYTGMTVGGFELSSSSYMIAGNKAATYTSSKPKNVYIATVPFNSSTASYKQITNVTSASETCSTPQLVKISDNSFLVLWTQGSNLKYVKVDGSGNIVGSIQSTTLSGALSDCQPILVGNNVVWYTWKNDKIKFYELNTSTLNTKVMDIQVGHDYGYGTPVDGKIELVCKKCGDTQTKTIPTTAPSVNWKTGNLISSSPGSYKAGDDVRLRVWYNGSADLKDCVVTSSNSNIVEVGEEEKDLWGDSEYPLNIKQAGIVDITVASKYDSSLARKYTIRVGEEGEIPIGKCSITLDKLHYTYDGSAFTPAVTVKYKGYTLSSSKDYEVSYSDNVEVGKGVVTIKGKGIFGSSAEKNFTIDAIDIRNYTLTLDQTSYTYNGNEIKPNITVSKDSDILKENEDYTITYQDNENVGTALLMVKGINHFVGLLYKEYTINVLNLEDCDVSLEYDSVIYDGTEKTPEVTVKYKDQIIPDTCYEVIYADNKNVGTATVTVTAEGKNTTGSIQKQFHIGESSLKTAIVAFKDTGYVYTGSEIKPETVTVMCKGKLLQEDTDYTIKYSNHVNAGTATLTIVGIGKYADMISKNYTISKRNVSDAMIMLSQSSYIYDEEKTPEVEKVVDALGNVIPESDYTVQYRNNLEPGTASAIVTIKESSQNYTGIKSAEFEIKELIPTSFRVWWRDNDQDGNVYYSYVDKNMKVGSSYRCWIEPDCGTVGRDMEVLSSNTNVIEISYDTFYEKYIIKAVGAGTAVVTIQPKKNHDIAETYTFTVTKDSSSGGSGTEGDSGNTGNPDNPDSTYVPDVDVFYRTHVQTYGDQEYVSNGTMSGTSGEAKRLESIYIYTTGNSNLGIQYTTHCQTYGWLPWSSNDDMCGTQGEAKRLEAIKIKLTGADANKYDVYYRVHAQSYGWLGWAKNGQPSGTAGLGKRLEGIQIVVVKRGQSFDHNMKGIESLYSSPYYALSGNGPEYEALLDPQIPGDTTPNVTYRTHVQTYGWQGWRFNGAMSGTSGEAKRLEGIQIRLTNKDYSGGIRYTTHVQTYGWQGNINNPSTWRSDGVISGTSGEAKRLEAICITLTGEMANHYDIYYRVHAQTYGWLGWAKNGEPSGTATLGKRLEGIQIVLVPKGQGEPGRTYKGVTSIQSSAYITR